MNTAAHPLSTQHPAPPEISDPDLRPQSAADSPIHRRWPALAGAIGSQNRAAADAFSRAAYDCVESGIIRQHDRRRLSGLAGDLAIRPFDAQLLIACALRQWVLDRRYDSAPSRDAPALSFEYQSWKRVCTRISLVFIFAITLDAVILWKWLS